MLFPTNVDTLVATRSRLLASVCERRDWETSHHAAEDIVSKLKTLAKFERSVIASDAFTLGYIAAMPEDTYAAIFNSHRVTSACFNVYAMPKVLSTSRMLNGSKMNGEDYNDETVCGVALALQRGITEGKIIANFMADFMCRDGKRKSYDAAASTQASSALRAMEALKVVRKTSGKTWQVAMPSALERLCDAAQGIHASADTAPSSDVPMPPMPATDDGITIDGECFDIESIDTSMLALPSPSASPLPVLAALEANERNATAYHAATLALPAPVAPVKASRKAKKAK